MIKRMLIAVTFLFAVLLLMLPKTDEASKRKMGSAAMLMCSNEFRKEIAALVLRDEAVQLHFDNHCPELISKLELDEEGALTLYSAQHNVSMQLTPVVEAGRVRWSCRGEPAESITGLCKP